VNGPVSPRRDILRDWTRTVTFSSTIISHYTLEFGCAGVRGVVNVAVAARCSTGRMLETIVVIVHVVRS
jgi:hypothetical protein